MLTWLRKRFERSGMSWRATRNVSVSIGADTIVVRGPRGDVSSLRWDELTSVTILTTDTGPFETDLFWLLAPRERHRTLAVPIGAEGESELLQAMQSRLSGFDNETLIKAMSSTSRAAFTVWGAASEIESADCETPKRSSG